MTFTHPFALFSSVALLFVADLAPGLSSPVVATPDVLFVLEKNASNDLPRTRSLDDGKHEERAGVNFETVGSALDQLEANVAMTKKGGSLAHLFTQEPATVHGPIDNFLKFLKEWNVAERWPNSEFQVDHLMELRRKALVSLILRLDLGRLVKGLSQEDSFRYSSALVNRLGQIWSDSEMAIAIHEALKRPSSDSAMHLEAAQFEWWRSNYQLATVAGTLKKDAEMNKSLGDVETVNAILKQYDAYRRAS